jgi:hypothetical protein
MWTVSVIPLKVLGLDNMKAFPQTIDRFELKETWLAMEDLGILHIV